MRHEENGFHIPESSKELIIRMDNMEDDISAFLYKFTDAEIKHLKRIESFEGNYILELCSGGGQITLEISNNLKELERKMIEFITGRKWEVSKEKTYIPVL